MPPTIHTSHDRAERRHEVVDVADLQKDARADDRADDDRHGVERPEDAGQDFRLVFGSGGAACDMAAG